MTQSTKARVLNLLTSNRRTRSALLAAVAGAALAGNAFAIDGTWTFNGVGNYGDVNNWAAATVADGSGATADFNSIDLTANATVTLDSARTLGNLIFGDTDPVNTPAIWTLAATNTLTLAGTTPTITTNTNAIITGLVAGSSGITKQGAGTLDIAGLTTPVNTSLTGGLNIAAGSVRIRGNSAISTVTPAGSISGAGTLVIGNASGNTATIDVDLTTFTGTLLSPAASTRWGSSSSAPGGTITAGGLNTTFDLGAGGNLFYRNGTNGNIIFQIGALAGQSGAFVSGGNTAGNGSVLFQIGNKGITSTFGGVIRDGLTKSAITKVGAGNQILTGVNTYTGPTAINAGTLTVGDGGQLMGSATITVANGAHLAVTGSGVVNNPRIVLNTGSTFDVTGASSTYTSQAGNTLVGTGTIVGNYNHGNGTMSPGTLGGAGTLNFSSNLTLNGGQTQFDLATSGVLGNTNDEIEVGGILDLQSGTLAFNFLSAPVAGNSYPLIHHTGALNGSLFALKLNTGLRGTFSLSDTSNILSLNIGTLITGSANITWTGNNSTAWDVDTTPNWQTAGGAATFFQGDATTFDDSTGNGTVVITASVLPASVTVNSNSTNYAFSGTGGIAGTGNLTKSGTTSLTLSTSNSYSGGTTMNGGTIVVQSNNSLGTGSVVLNDGTLDLGTTSAPTNQLNIPSGKTAAVQGGSGGGAVGISQITGAGTLNIVTLAGVFDFRGDASTFTGTINTSGTGGIRINQGSTATYNLSQAFVNLGTGISVRNTSTTNVTIGALSGNSTSALAGAGGSGATQTVTYTVGSLNLSTQFDGIILNGSGNGTITSTTVNFNKVGTGTLILTGANTYTGLTTVNGGALVLGPNAQSPVLTGGGADLKAGKLIFDYNGGTDPTPQVQTILDSAFDSNFSSGQIHTSNTTDLKKGIGYSNDTSASKLTVAYSYYGDANLDKQVNNLDFTALGTNFGTGPGATWQQGDFNYDGKVNALDFNAISTNFGAAVLPAPVLGSLVPEPASLALIGLGGLALRRRRK